MSGTAGKISARHRRRLAAASPLRGLSGSKFAVIISSVDKTRYGAQLLFYGLDIATVTDGKFLRSAEIA